MAQVTNKTTYTRSLRIAPGSVSGIVPSIIVPTPNVSVTGTSTAFTANSITDTTKDFVALGVRVGDIISNPTNGLNSLITVVTTTQITFSVASIFAATGAYNVHSQTDAGSVAAYDGFVLYNTRTTTNAALTVRTLDNYTLNIQIPAGGICPIQLNGVTANGNAYGDIIALW